MSLAMAQGRARPLPPFVETDEPSSPTPAREGERNEHLLHRRMSTHQDHGRGDRECVVDGRREQSMSNTRVPAQASVDTSWMVVASSR